jgi:ABC-type uncharacterized transport system substrate-binding protein
MLSSRGDSQQSRPSRRTSVIPIVFAIAADPLGTGLVASLVRPGGNITGVSTQAGDLAGKRLELLRETVPGLRRLTVLANINYAASVIEMSQVQAAARTLGLEVVALEIRRADEIARVRCARPHSPSGRNITNTIKMIPSRIRWRSV